jgi:DNA-binding MarR family transcriptional regulator
LDDETRDAAIRLQILATRLLRIARSAHGRQGLGSAQYSAMAVLYDRGPLPLGELARAERVSHPTMSRIVAALVRMGAAERLPDPSDRRTRRVGLTPDGRALYERISANRVEVTAAILAQLRKETVAELLEVVGRVAGPLEEALRAD